MLPTDIRPTAAATVTVTPTGPLMLLLLLLVVVMVVVWVTVTLVEAPIASTGANNANFVSRVVVMWVVVVVVVLAAVYVVAVVEPHRIRHFVAVSVLHPFCVDPRLHSEHLLHCSRPVSYTHLTLPTIYSV